MLEHFKNIAPQYVSRDYDSGNTILFQGEVPRMACVLLSGVVRAINISNQGEEQTISFHTAGEFFPSSWIFDKTSTSIYFYEAVTDARVCFIPRKDLIDSFTTSATSQNLLVDYLATSYSASELRISALGQSKAREKIMLTLYYLCQRHGSRLRSGKVRIDLKLTHHHIASLVGLTRETTATELNKLKRKNIVSYKSQIYVVSVDQLLRSLGEESFESIYISNQQKPR